MSATNPWNQDKPYDLDATWLASRPYLEIINHRITGDPKLGWFPYAVGRYVLGPGARHGLLLGSSEGHMEVGLRDLGFAGEIVATDVAERALERARSKVRDRGFEGIEHRRLDLNVDPVEGSFDFIIAEGVLHHIERIDNCLDSLLRCLRPGGHLIAMEYVGAWRFQLPEIQLAWINAALAVVPRKYRPLGVDDRPTFPISLAERSRVYYVPPSIEAMVAYDPSEAVSGHLLPAALKARFEIVEEKPAGGQLLTFMVGHFPFAETNTNPDCEAWLRVIAQIEETLSDQAIVPSDLVFYVCRRR